MELMELIELRMRQARSRVLLSTGYIVYLIQHTLTPSTSISPFTLSLALRTLSGSGADCLRLGTSWDYAGHGVPE